MHPDRAIAEEAFSPFSVIARLDRATRSGTPMLYVIETNRAAPIEAGLAFVGVVTATRYRTGSPGQAGR